jgi:hypothetical protein
VVRYHTEAECDQKLSALPASIKGIYCIPYECATIEEWEAEVRADEARRRREQESEHPTYD